MTIFIVEVLSDVDVLRSRSNFEYTSYVMAAPDKTPDRRRRIIDRRNLTDATFVLKIERREFEFTAGQHMMLGLAGFPDSREYSVYSGEADPYIEVLMREVEDGLLTPHFQKLQPGDELLVYDPVGSFTIPPELREGRPLVFIASGTGIAPFHCFTRTYPTLDYQLLHGVRFLEEAYERERYDPARHVLCTSRDDRGSFAGRVTDYLRQNPPDPSAHFYVCGNYQMINEVYSILEEGGVPSDRLRSEIYFHF